MTRGAGREPVRAADGVDRCPPRHTEYLSEQTAYNAGVLHMMMREHCPRISYWRCQDHWHIGHPTWLEGQDCKANAVKQPKRTSRRA